jgi:hypothetical protein
VSLGGAEALEIYNSLLARDPLDEVAATAGRTA